MEQALLLSSRVVQKDLVPAPALEVTDVHVD